MAKLFRFLVTMPAKECPSPIAAHMADEVKLLLSRSLNKVAVRPLKRSEGLFHVKRIGRKA